MLGPASLLRIHAQKMNQSLGVILCREERETKKPDQLAEEELCLHVIGPSPRQSSFQYPSLGSKAPSYFFDNLT